MQLQLRELPAPEVAPRQPAFPPALEPRDAEPRPHRRWWWWLVAGAFVCAGALYQKRAAAPQRVAPQAAVRTAKVRVGTIERTLRISGTTAAARLAFVSTPFLRGSRSAGHGHFSLFIQKLAEPGSMVKRGDVLAEFDRQYMLVRLDDYQALLVQHQLNLKRLQTQLELRRSAYDQRMRTAKGAWDKAALDLKTAPVRSAIQTEQFRLNTAEAESAYRELQKNADLMMISESSANRRMEADLRVAEIEARRAEQNVQKMVVRSPIDGMVVLETIHLGGQEREIQPGDEMHPGHVFLQVMDTSSMVVQARVNQVDAGELRLGVRARVRFEAYPGLELPARLRSIGTLSKASGFRGSFVRNIPIRLEIETRDPGIAPNLSASADVILDASEDAAILPLECVFEEDGKTVAYIAGPSGWEKRGLELGLTNNVAVEVRSGVQEGDVAAAQRPALEQAAEADFAR